MDLQQPIVYLVDDDPDYLESLAVLVSSMGYQTRGFSSGAAFLEAFDRSTPGCIIADLRMPDLDGLALLDRLAAEPLAPPVIFVTAHGEVPTAVQAMRRGAVAFLQKRAFGETSLWEAIHAALARDGKNRAQRSREEELQRRLAAITGPEQEVLRMLVRGSDHTQIAETLGVSRRTVENRRSKIMKKLGAASFPELVRLAVEAGLLKDGEP